MADQSGGPGMLRQFVLDMAIRGRLVPQIASEKATSQSIQRPGPVATPRELLARRKSVRSLDIPIDSLPFTVPTTWDWVPLISVCEVTYGFAFNSALFGPRGTGRPLVRIRDISSTDTTAYFTGPFDTHYLIRRGDYLVGMDGDFNVRRWEGPEALLNQRVLRMSSWKPGISPDWVRMPLQSILSHLHEATSQTTVKHLSAKQVNGIRIPLPPPAEQRSIVAKVDELMALCDQLETAQKERDARRDGLRAASLNRLRASDGNGKPGSADVRFFLDTSPRLVTTPVHVASIRQLILKLAVRGQIVRQDPSDEPADDLIAHIQTEKQSVERRGKPSIQLGAIHDIPQTWRWVRFGDVTMNRDGERIPVSKEERSARAKVYDYYGASGVIDKIDDFLFDKPLLLIGEDGANLINRSTPIAFIARGQYWVNNHAHVIDGTTEGFLRYIELHINAIDLKPYLTGTAQPKMNQARMNAIRIALPPEREQLRILAKVDELMSLCDELEAALASAQDGRARLLGVLLHQALEDLALPKLIGTGTGG
jgi:type I restriction enzyme, S subunit